jgi:hypothetical protein
VTVKVDASPASVVKMVIIIAPDPLGFSQPCNAPPYEFRIPLPSRIRPSRYRLYAVGIVAPGKGAKEDSIEIVVEPSELPVSLPVKPSTVCVAVGEASLVEIDGMYRDGTTIYLVESEFLETRSEAPGIAHLKRGKSAITGVALGTTKLIVTYRGLKVEVPVSVVWERRQCIGLRPYGNRRNRQEPAKEEH